MMSYGVQVILSNNKEVKLEEWNPVFFIDKIPTLNGNSSITRTYPELAGKGIEIVSHILTVLGSNNETYYTGVNTYPHTISWNSGTGTLTIRNNDTYNPSGYHIIEGVFS